MKTAHAIIIAGAIVAAAVIYAASGGQTGDAAPYEQAVREKLRDPDSAKFRNVSGDKIDGQWCGEVNAKNGMGGYAGWQRFSAMRTVSGDWLVSMDEDIVAATCG